MGGQAKYPQKLGGCDGARQPGCRVSALNPDGKGLVESKGNVKAEKKLKWFK